MTSDRRFEGDLPDLLAQLAPGPTPDYRDHIVRQTARMRQRPAWMFPERWIPMTAVTSRAAGFSRVPWRTVGLVVLLLIALVVGALLVAGSQPRLPAPFGPAANGLVAYADKGDIYTADPVSGIATAVVTGPQTDLGPVFSRDGTSFVFERKAQGTFGPGRLYVAGIDGREPIAVTPEPIEGLHTYTFSPNGREIAFTSGFDEDHGTLSIAKADGTGVRALDVGMGASRPSFRPPDGREIAFVGLDGDLVGLFAVDVVSGAVRTIVAPSTTRHLGLATGHSHWSPTGSHIAFLAWDPSADALTARTHVVAADATGDRMLPVPSGVLWDAPLAWSNDGTRLATVRGYSPGYEDVVLAVVPADGSGMGVETPHDLKLNENCCSTHEWSPDDTSILTTAVDADGKPGPQLVWDPSTGRIKPAPWAATSNPTWQRLAP